MKKVSAAALGLGLAVAFVYLFLAPAFSGDFILRQSFSVGGLKVHFYGLIIGAAILAGYFASRANSWRFGISKDDIDRYAFWAVIWAVVGARAYFVLFAYKSFDTPVDALKIWEGGLSIYGALISGAMFTYLYSQKKAYTFWQLLDVSAFGLPLAQAIGRFGNFVNYEAYGTETELPWKMFVPGTNNFHHPVFLYESLASLMIFAVLWKRRGRGRTGSLAMLYLILYSSVRFLMEFIRTDDFMLAGLGVNQVVSAAVLVGAATAFRLRNRKQ